MGAPGLKSSSGLRYTASSDEEEDLSSCSEVESASPKKDGVIRIRQSEFLKKISAAKTDKFKPKGQNELDGGSQLMIW